MLLAALARARSARRRATCPRDARRVRASPRPSPSRSPCSPHRAPSPSCAHHRPLHGGSEVGRTPSVHVPVEWRVSGGPGAARPARPSQEVCHAYASPRFALAATVFAAPASAGEMRVVIRRGLLAGRPDRVELSPRRLRTGAPGLDLSRVPRGKPSSSRSRWSVSIRSPSRGHRHDMRGQRHPPRREGGDPLRDPRRKGAREERRRPRRGRELRWFTAPSRSARAHPRGAPPLMVSSPAAGPARARRSRRGAMAKSLLDQLNEMTVVVADTGDINVDPRSSSRATRRRTRRSSRPRRRWRSTRRSSTSAALVAAKRRGQGRERARPIVKRAIDRLASSSACASSASSPGASRPRSTRASRSTRRPRSTRRTRSSSSTRRRA